MFKLHSNQFFPKEKMNQTKSTNFNTNSIRQISIRRIVTGSDECIFSNLKKQFSKFMCDYTDNNPLHWGRQSETVQNICCSIEDTIQILHNYTVKHGGTITEYIDCLTKLGEATYVDEAEMKMKKTWKLCNLLHQSIKICRMGEENI